MIGVLMLLLRAASVTVEIGCTAMTPFLSACLNFVTYGSRQPIPGSPCCEAMVNISDLADSTDHYQSLCRCFSGHFTTAHASNVTAISLLPRFCEVHSLGFNIGPKTYCNYVTYVRNFDGRNFSRLEEIKESMNKGLFPTLRRRGKELFHFFSN